MRGLLASFAGLCMVPFEMKKEKAGCSTRGLVK